MAIQACFHHLDNFVYNKKFQHPKVLHFGGSQWLEINVNFSDDKFQTISFSAYKVDYLLLWHFDDLIIYNN